MFGGHQAEIGHQLPRIGEASKVSDLGYHGDRNHQGDPAHRLERRNDRGHRPARQQLLDLPRQPVEPGFGVLDHVNVVLQHDLLRRMGKAYRGQPTPIVQRPRPNPAIDLVVAQQEALQMLACLGQDPARRRPRPHQVAHGFMRGVGDPDRCQLAGPAQSRQAGGVVAIGLHPVARPLGDQRWRHHDAIMAATGQQPVQPLTTRAGS